MVNGWQTRSREDGTHRRERYDEEDDNRNRPPSWKASGDHDQKARSRKKQQDKDEMEIITDLFTV
jgi:hypothetical protein